MTDLRRPSRSYSADDSMEASDDTSLHHRGDGSAPCDTNIDKASQLEQRRICEWCEGPIHPYARRDSKTCSKRCRQAKARFRVGRCRSDGTAGRPMRYAYADPPYPGLARKYYDDVEVDHAELVTRLVAEFPDGWALSTSAKALQEVLALCPPGVRVCSWYRGPRASVAYRARSAWEPVIVAGGRPRRLPVSDDLSDALLWGGRQHSHPGALVGMKPAAFCEWVLQLLGVQPGDTLVDLFPGSGVMGRAFRLYVSGDVDPDTSCLAGAERRLADLAGDLDRPSTEGAG